MVTQEGEERIERITSFKNAGLHTAMERNVVDLYGYKTPTPIQQYCVPAINKGYDLLAVAQTGKQPAVFIAAQVFVRQPLTHFNLRIWKNRSLSHPDSQPLDGKGEETVGPASRERR